MELVRKINCTKPIPKKWIGLDRAKSMPIWDSKGTELVGYIVTEIENLTLPKKGWAPAQLTCISGLCLVWIDTCPEQHVLFAGPRDSLWHHPFIFEKSGTYPWVFWDWQHVTLYNFILLRYNHFIPFCKPRSTTGPAWGGHRGKKLIITRECIQSFSNITQNFCFLVSFWY